MPSVALWIPIARIPDLSAMACSTWDWLFLSVGMPFA